MRMTMTTMTTKRRKRGRRITMRMTGRRLVATAAWMMTADDH